MTETLEPHQNFDQEPSQITLKMENVGKIVADIEHLKLFRLFSQNLEGDSQAQDKWKEIDKEKKKQPRFIDRFRKTEEQPDAFPDRDTIKRMYNVDTTRAILSLIQRHDIDHQKTNPENKSISTMKKLVIVTGSPGAGKTSLTMAWANATEKAYKSEVGVGYLAFEQNYFEFRDRQILPDTQWSRITWLRLAVQMKRQYIKLLSELKKDHKEAIIFCEIPGTGTETMDRCRAFIQHMLHKHADDVLVVNLVSNSKTRSKAAQERNPENVPLDMEQLISMADAETINRISSEEVAIAIEWESGLAERDPAKLRIEALRRYLFEMPAFGPTSNELKQIAVVLVYWWTVNKEAMQEVVPTYSAVSIVDETADPLKFYYSTLVRKNAETEALLAR